MAAIALDTNLLLLLIVGQVHRAFIGKHKRLRAFTERDFDALVEILSRAQSVVTTPHALTEASNLVAFGVQEPLRSAFYDELARLIRNMEERHQPSHSVVADAEFTKLGLADCAWLRIADAGTVFLTDDLLLYLAAQRRGWNAVNFNHIREQRGLI